MASGKNLITFKLWNAGLINQLMSVECASIISAYTDNPVFIHSNTGLDSSWRNISQSRTNILGNKFPKINDLIEFNTDLHFYENKFEDAAICVPEIVVQDFFQTALCLGGAIPDTDFLEGRKYLRIEQNTNYRFIGTLGWYSIVFYDLYKTQCTRNWEVNFRNEYVNVAHKIINEIGEFAAIHIRQKDHAAIAGINSDDINAAIDSLCSKTVLVLSDDYSNRWNPSSRNHMNIDDVIMHNFKNEILALPFHDETVFGLISLLVASSATEFIGTPGSTYSGYIMRNVNKKNHTNNWRYIGNIDTHNRGKYSWNAYKNMPIETKVWWMEWEESLDWSI